MIDLNATGSGLDGYTLLTAQLDPAVGEICGIFIASTAMRSFSATSRAPPWEVLGSTMAQCLIQLAAQAFFWIKLDSGWVEGDGKR